MSLNHKANKDEVAEEFQYTRRLQAERIQQLKEDLARKEKFNQYTARLVGELMGLLIRKKVLTKQECMMLTGYCKGQIFTQGELIELQKMADKQMQQARQ